MQPPTNAIIAYGDCDTCRVTLDIPSQQQQQSLKLAGTILGWIGFGLFVLGLFLPFRRRYQDHVEETKGYINSDKNTVLSQYPTLKV